MAEFCEVTKLIRNKNAGSFEPTFDIMFETREGFDAARRSGL